MNSPSSCFGPDQPYNYRQHAEIQFFLSFKAYLGSPQNQHWPSGLENWVPRTSCLLDFVDLFHSPCHGVVEICINIVEIFHEANLITVSTEQGRELLVIHATENGALTNLEAVKMKDWKDGPGLFGVNVLDSVPGANQ